ncbi:AbrB family transcriptional regulator [Pseudomonas stutzeri]|nr:AbrB family transcriptional regulator [Stutzerimonas stutzeri]
MRRPPDARGILSGALVGLTGGYLASLAGAPLPWLLGSLLGVALARCAGLPTTPLPAGRQAGQWLLASAVGLHLSREAALALLEHLPLLLAGALGTLLLSLIGIVLLRRGGVDPATAFFASLPGGASEMVNLAQRHQAEPAQVAAAHSLRLLLVLLLVPAAFAWGLPPPPVAPSTPGDWPALALLLAGGLLAARLWRHLGQPNPWMLGPLLLCATASAGLDLQLAVPDGLACLGQWLLGGALGMHFDRGFFRRAPGFLARVLLFSLLAMLAAALLGAGLGLLAGGHGRELMLGSMPGGITELGLTAQSLQLSVALVGAQQLLRLLLVMLLAEPLYLGWRRLERSDRHA